MNIKSVILQTAAVALMASYASAKFAEDGPWSDVKDVKYSKKTRFGVKNGVPYSGRLFMRRMMVAGQPLDGHVDKAVTKEDYEHCTAWFRNGCVFRDYENVYRVKQILSKDDFNETFPNRNSLYEYEDFLRAVAKYPKFCGEYRTAKDYPATGKNGPTWERACRQELATLFAHFSQETSGLKEVHEGKATRGPYTKTDKNNKKWYPATKGEQYYGRGPMQVSWNYNYGMFGNIFDSQTMDGKLKFLEDPDEMVEDGYTAFASALWFYMTPQDAKPSMHDIMTGYWKPNKKVDGKANITASFAATTVIANGEKECGDGLGKNAKAVNRGNHFKRHMKDLGMPTDKLKDADLDCGKMPKLWPSGSRNDNLYQYWQKDTKRKDRCKPVNWFTEYSIYAPDDYKRCVCAEWGSDDAACSI